MEPPVPPASDPDPEGELTLVREPLGAFIPRLDPQRRPGLRVLSLALTAILVVVAAGAILERVRQPSVASETVPLLATPTSPPTPAPTIPPGQGWMPAGPSWAQWIVFAPSAPGTAYLCGTPSNTDPTRQAPVSLGHSRDSGGTWQSWATSISATACVVDVDPTNAYDLLLEVWPCVISASVSCPTELYRSFDGGHNWHVVALPPTPGSSSGPPVVFYWAWQGSTLFVGPSSAGTQTPLRLAVSVAAGPLVWVNQKALLAGIPADSQFNSLYANMVAVYVDFYVASSSGTSTILTKVSTDQGATWSVFQPQYQGKTVRLVDFEVSLADGATIVGEVESGQNANTGNYVTSTDGGATWTPLAAAPGFLLIMGLVSTPSGAYYAEMTSPNGYATAVPGVYRLAPGTSTWVLVGALPSSSGGPLAVSWDEQGQPLALWSIAQTPSTPTSDPAGLVTHTP
jgi:hypothetical protein